MSSGLFRRSLLRRTPTKMILRAFRKWFLESVGHDGLNRMLDGFNDRSAYALCTFAFSRGPGTEPILFEGRTEVDPNGMAMFWFFHVF